MKRFVVIIFFIVSVVFGFNVCAKASDTIVNNYARVTSLNNFNSIDPDTLQLDSLLDKSSKQLFFDGDTVLIHQTKGAIFGYPSTDIKKAGTLIDVGATGSFEIHIVKKVDVLNKYLILQGNLHLHPDFINIGGYKAFNANHILQVVKVFTYRKKRIINKTITSIPWDSISKKGGIVAIIGDSIKLGGNIDVSGKGFLGADPGNIISTAHCSKEDSVKLKAFSFLRNAFDSSGLKGESFIVFDSLPRGRKPARTGGGGGNGYFAGGGGGGNYNSNSGSDNSGGDGGDEGASCGMSTTTNTGGLAGLSNYIVYNNSNNVAALFGGGGGCSIQSATLKATKGGNGGGIILIMANYLDGNGFSINANGSSVLDSASSGAGGGGAGGTILLDINKYKNSIVSAQGGNGGSTIKNLLDGSHGGGGGGGLIWYNGVKPDSVNVIRGVRGNPPWWDSRNAQNGRSGGTITSLRLPLYNFLYNIMPANQEVCEADVPMQIKATDPKGGVNYEYLWQKSVNLSIWDSVGNAKLFQPPSLMVTTYYRRIVRALTNDNNLITTDTSYAVKINVLPKIVNNTIVKDTIEICKGLKFPYVHANNLLSGGNGKFKYKWQDSSSVWHSSGMADSSYYRHPDSIKSIYIRLYVTSGACKSYTPMVKITVWQPISADSIAQSQWVEKGRMSKPLTSLGSLSGGSSIYTYLWQQSKNGLSWSSASIPNTLIGYTTPYFDSTRFYRRIVYSGQYNTCKDTSNNLKITIID